MLSYLQIENIGIIDSLSLEFFEGLNALTGETGAGKSIIVNSLNIVLGSKINAREILKKGAQKGKVTAQFVIQKSHPVIHFINESGFDTNFDDIIVMREINLEGRSKCFFNGQLVPQSFLSELGDFLIDIHGIHDHQKLLKPDTHLSYLDRFGDYQDLIHDFARLYEQFQQVENERDAIRDRAREWQEKKELILFQRDELGYLKGLSPEDEETIEKEFSIQADQTKIMEMSSMLVELLEGEAGLLETFAHCRKKLSGLGEYFTELKEYDEEINAVSITLSEISDKVGTLTQNMVMDPKLLREKEELISRINKHKKKYQTDFPGLLKLYSQVQQLCLEGDNFEMPLFELDKKINDFSGQLQGLSEKLGTKRRQTAKKLSLALTRELSDLGMTHSEVRIEVIDCETFNRHGKHSVNFLIKTNLGENFGPLNRIVSGGELCRIMLGFKHIMSEWDDIPVLIFDEIDANIGGVTSVIAGEKMNSIASHCQVVTITHQPQIAAKARHHFSVEKTIQNGQTTTRVKYLNDSERIEEISRMLGGNKISSVVKKHAAEMLQIKK